MKKKKNFLPIILVLIFLSCSDSENIKDEIQNLDTNPYIGNVILTTQEEVDNFGALNHTSISGDLRIQNPAPNRYSNIFELSKLKTLRLIGYDLILNYNFNLTDFTGLNNVFEIGRDVIIRSNENITSIEGLNSIVTINRNLNIESNPKLRNLNSLGKLKTVKGILSIQGNGTSTIGINDFCGISSLILNNGLLGTYAVANNKGFNPTKDDIKNGKCSN